MKGFIVTALSFLIQQHSFAWGDLGHSTVGYLAEKHLSLDGKKFIHSVLGPEPLGLSAIWPDQVRDDQRFSPFSSYHFLEIPVGFKYETVPAQQRAPYSADTIITEGQDLLKGKSLNLLQKQVMLRYLIHVVGDVHQPLHIGNGLDRGGNLCDVWFKDPFTGHESKQSLHSVWDSGLVDYIKKKVLEEGKNPPKYFSYGYFAEALLKEAQESGELEKLRKMAQTSSKVDWYHESNSLHRDVYPEAVTVLPQERNYCKFVNLGTGKIEEGKYDKDNLPRLSLDYISKSSAIIKTRLILGGLRLAQEIEKLAAQAKGRRWKSEEKDFFEKILPRSKVRGPSSAGKKVKSSL